MFIDMECSILLIEHIKVRITSPKCQERSVTVSFWPVP